ncbi:MAG: iron chelate uptake ABC transporter family permease subunit, partial [Proteobacteria bacterium]|nr:iron chelate uptake ABC transporter family permease subunit [Pseudomonadota bacterium]
MKPLLKPTIAYGALLGLLVLVSLLSLKAGPAALSFADVLAGLIGSEDHILETIVRQLRLPQLLLGLLVGATLGISGVALQALFKNPLAEPGVIGVSSSAALGAVVVLYFGYAGVGDITLPL